MARRRADEFQRLLEGSTSSSAGASRHSGELAELAALTADLQDVPRVDPRPSFSSGLREQLMTAAATELQPDRVPVPAPRSSDTGLEDKLTVGHGSGPAARHRRNGRITVFVAALSLVGGATGAAVASQGSLPGDSLYPVKRAIEDVNTRFASGEFAQGSAQLRRAENRLDEINALLGGDLAANSGDLRAALESFADHASNGSGLLMRDFQANDQAISITQVRNFTGSSMADLAAMESLIPDDAHQELTDAADAISQIDQAAAALCAECGTGVTEIPPALLGSHVSSDSPVLPDLDGPVKGSTTDERDDDPDTELPSDVPDDLNATDPDADPDDSTSDNKQSTDPDSDVVEGEDGEVQGGEDGILEPDEEEPKKGNPLSDLLGGLVDGLTGG